MTDQAPEHTVFDELAAGDPTAVPFSFVVTCACPGSYPCPCQHPASAGMADTFAVS